MNKGDLPLHEYFSLHAYLSTLLVSVFIFLPRSTLWFIEEGSQRSSADRPEHPFLTPITSRPLTTMTWDVLGMLTFFEAAASTLAGATVLFVLLCALGAPLDRPETQLERALVYPVIGTLIGATVGVLPIPLDWDRPWQSYPLTISFASILGFVIGGFVSFVQSALAAGLFEETTKPSAPSVKVSSKKKRRS
ncbi:hypothetical protein IAU60_005754 [Kwoniella sp. DSM 27419]